MKLLYCDWYFQHDKDFSFCTGRAEVGPVRLTLDHNPAGSSVALSIFVGQRVLIWRSTLALEGCER